MAKKSKKVEKETRRLIEGITDLVKKKGDRYKFKTKSKKTIKKIKKTCVHWVYAKGKETPAVIRDPENPNANWKCTICGAVFPLTPKKFYVDEEGEKHNPYEELSEEMLALVNQIQFWAVKLGGDSDDTKMFLRLKSDLPRFGKVAKQVLKQVNKRQSWEKNREKSDILSQFDAYTSFNYKM